MEKDAVVFNEGLDQIFSTYELKFKALGDRKRLQILKILTQRGSMCVCDLAPIVDMPQSKLSYHLKILLDAELVTKECKGTWSYYTICQQELENLISKEAYTIFKK
ncbi:ArsR/SmtB family transcription factor [Peribacillus sp. SCS-155]|uniref:ArsR/SmtB family transcription factor n=1 Tax=Peribacillus sedimenti TaxID=3115297 RepID=UPI0039065B90